MTHMDDSLARGLAQAFIEHVAESDRICAERRERCYRRGRLPRSDNLKGYRKAIEHVRGWTPERYRLCEWSVQRGKKAVWCGSRLTLSDEVRADGLTLMAHEVTSTGRRGTFGMRVTVSHHALQRVIQRSGLARPPLDKFCMDALQAEFNALPMWLMPAVFALRMLEPDEGARRALLVPADHGVFLGCDAGEKGIVITTYVGECDEMWSELSRALKQLRQFDEATVAPFHAAICHPEWEWAIDEDVPTELCRVWREWVWLNREREDRPKRDDRAWAMHRTTLMNVVTA